MQACVVLDALGGSIKIDESVIESRLDILIESSTL